MFHCTFELNGEPTSKFVAGAASYPAFSGLYPNINKRASACLASVGPIPPGEYYVLDRQSGGRLGALYDAIGWHSGWFALYAIDGTIDDETYCDQVKRGAFRLHPKGQAGISQGCIVIEKGTDFQHLRGLLTSIKPLPVNGTKFLAYGKVTVR